MLYSEVRNYGFNIIMRKYAKFPLFLPLPAHMEHGWTPTTDAEKSDLKTEKPLMLVFSKRRKTAWQKESKVSAAVMGSPFIHYKNYRALSIKPNAKGTVVFPSHSTYDLKSQYSIEDYCKELKKLPREFLPITICLFWLDYIDPKADVYRKAGFKVVTAGPKITNSLEFVKNYYEILTSHKYATSNEIGTYTFYSVDLGLPFFLSGKSPVLLNKSLKDINVGAVTEIKDFDYGRNAIKIFSTGPAKTILAEQKKFVEDEMGNCDCLTSKQMHDLLWKFFWKNKFWLNFVPYILSTVIVTVVFNFSWVKYAIAIRKRMSEKQNK